MKKMALFVSVLLIMAIAFSSCAPATPDTSSAGTSSSTVSETPSNADEVASEETDPDAVELPEADCAGKKATILSWWDPADVSAKKYVEKFKEFYDAELEFMMVAWGDLTTQLAQMIMADNAPDIAMLRGSDFPMYAGLDYLMPVDDLFDLDSNLWKDQKVLLESMRYNGKMYNMPASVGVNYFVWYNKDILENAGLQDPLELYQQGQWTLDTMREYAKATADITGDVEMYGLAADAAILIDAMVKSAGTDFVIESESGYVLNFDDPVVNEVMNVVSDMYLVDKVMSPTDNSMEFFTSGKAAMFFEGSWSDMNDPMLTMHQNDTIGIVMFPQWDDETPMNQWALFDGFGIPKNAKDPELSAAVINTFRYVALDPTELEKTEAEYRERGWTDAELEMFKEATTFATPSLFFTLGNVPTEIWGISRDIAGGNPWSTTKGVRQPTCQKALDEFNAIIAGE